MMNLRHASLVPLLAVGLLSGCGTAPEDLAMPMQMSCVYLSEPMSQTGEYGLANITWETRLEKGPYVSERQDENGTYYRAPAGGLRTSSPGIKTVNTRDGGFYIPRNPNEPPKIYEYFSVENAPVEIPPEGVNCSNVGYIREPSTSKISVVSLAASGAIGGAAGGVIGRAAVGGGMSYGHAAGAGAAGGLIAGILIAEIINADVGNIHWSWSLQDPAFIAKLRALEASKVPVKEISPESASR